MDFLGIMRTRRYGAAVLVRNKKLVSSHLQTFGWTKSHDQRLPLRALAECLNSGGLSSLDSVGAIGLTTRYSLELSQIFSSTMDTGRGLLQSLKNLPQSLHDELSSRLGVRRDLSAFEREKNPEILFFSDELAWTRGIFQSQPYQRALILNLDLGKDGRNSSLTAMTSSGPSRLWLAEYPNSLGLLIQNLATFCRFSGRRAERQFLQLARYGESALQEEFDQLIEIRPDGSFSINADFVSNLSRLFPGERRNPDAPITSREIAISYTIHQLMEKIVHATWRAYDEAKAEALLLPLCTSALSSMVGTMLKTTARQRQIIILSEKEVAVNCAVGLAIGAQAETMDLPLWTSTDLPLKVKTEKARSAEMTDPI